MLPDKGGIIPLVFDNGRKTVVPDFFGRDSLCDIVHTVTDRTGVCSRALGGAQTDTALCTGEFNGVALLRHGVDGIMADGAFCRRTLALVKDNIVAAVRTLAACQLFRADVDNVTTGAVDFFTREETLPRLGISSAGRTLYYEFGHGG